MKRLLFALAASAGLALGAAERAEPDTLKLMVVGFGNIESSTRVEEWLGKLVENQQQAASLPGTKPLGGATNTVDTRSVYINWSSHKVELTHETDMITAENQRNRKLLNDIRMKVLTDAASRYVTIAKDYLQASLAEKAGGLIQVIERGDDVSSGVPLILTAYLGDREEDSRTVQLAGGTKVKTVTYTQPYVGKVRDLDGNVVTAFKGESTWTKRVSDVEASSVSDPARKLVEAACDQIADKLLRALSRGGEYPPEASSGEADGARAASVIQEGKPRIAVAPFISKQNGFNLWGTSFESRNWMDAIIDHLSIQLTQLGSFIVLDRSFGPELDRELGRIVSDPNASPDDVCRLSNKLATDYLVVAEVMFSDVASPGKDYVTGLPLPPVSAQFAEIRFRCVMAPTTQIAWAETLRLDSRNFYGTPEVFTSSSTEYAAAVIAAKLQERLDPEGFAAEQKRRREAVGNEPSPAPAAEPAVQPVRGVKLGF